MTDEGQRGGGDTQITTIADAVLKLKELRESNKNLNEPDVEEQFARLSLAFKTDQFTLSQRLDLQKRQRDNAEKNIDSEVKSLRESLNQALNQLCTDSEMREIITKTQQHVDIVQQTTMRMSSRAETYGAIQQEKRMNCAFETMLSYVEHLKLLYDKEHLELEEYKKLITEHQLVPGEKGNMDSGEDKRTLPPRSQSLSSSSRPAFRRRGSLGTLVKSNAKDGQKPNNPENATKLAVPTSVIRPTIAINDEVRPRLLSAVCLLSSNSELPRTSNGTVILNPSLSPKSRRCSCPVGPMTQQPSFNNLSILPTVPADVHAPDIVSPIKELSRCEEATYDGAAGLIPSIATTLDSEGNVISEDVLASTQDSKGNNDSSDLVQLIPPLIVEPSSFENFAFSNPNCECNMRSRLSSLQCEDRHILTSSKSTSFLKFWQWSIKQNMLYLDKAVLLRLRYMLSAALGLAAMFSLLWTILPYSIMFL